MNRRGFLKGVGGVASVAAAVKVGAKEPISKGFGLAPIGAPLTIKASTAAYMGKSGVYVSTGGHSKELWPGIDKWAKEKYGREIQYAKLFSDE